MISGECRVEPISPSDSKVLLDGLRLRLDLRIVPGAEGAEAAAAAVWRIENPRVETLRLGVPVAYRRAAVACGAAALLMAVGLWLWRPATPRGEEAAGAAPAAVTPPAVGAAERAAPGVAPRFTDVTPSAASSAPAAAEVPSAPAASPRAPAALAPSAPAPSTAVPAAAVSPQPPSPPVTPPRAPAPPAVVDVGPSPRSLTAVPRVAAPHLREREMLDLFGDTK